MNIKHISIHNFRGMGSLLFSPAKLTFITGPSGSGKSSVMDAVRYLITGKSREDAIGKNDAMAAVSGDIERIGNLSRSMDVSGKSKVRLNGKTTTAKSVTEQFESLLGVSTAGSNLLTSSEVMAHSLGKDLADYLLNGGFLKNDITFSHLLELNPLAADVAETLKGVLPQEPAVISLQDIEAAYQQFRASRAPLKKMLAEESALAKYEGPIPTRKSTEIQKSIAQLQLEIAQQEKKAIEYPKAKKESEELAKNISETESKLSETAMLRHPTLAEREAVAHAEENARKLIDEAVAHETTIANDIDMLMRTLDTLQTDVCPISAALTCTTDKTSVKAELEQALSNKQLELEDIGIRLSHYKDDLTKAVLAREELAKRERDLEVRKMLLTQLDQLKSISIVLPEEPNPNTLRDSKNRLAALQSEYEYTKRYEDAASHRDRENALNNQLCIAEELVNQLAPTGGVRKQILEHGLEVLEDWCNVLMSVVLPQYMLHFDPLDNFSVVVTQLSHPTTPIGFEGLSNGEQLRIVFIIMAMVSELNGARICMVDNVNALDIASFKDFLKLVTSMEDSFDHIFIAGVDHAGFEEAVDSSTIDSTCIHCGK